MLKRKFRRNTNYIDFETVVTKLADCLTHEKLRQDAITLIQDHCRFSLLQAAITAYQNPEFPVYAIDRELIKMFLNTDLPSNLKGVECLFDNALILLPKGMFKDDNGCGIDWVFLRDTGRKDYTKYISLEDSIIKELKALFPDDISWLENIRMFNEIMPFSGREFAWATKWKSNQYEGIYCSGFIITEEGNLALSDQVHGNILTINPDHNATFAHKISKLLIHCVLFLQTQRNQKTVSSGNLGFSITSKKHEKEVLQEYRYLNLPSTNNSNPTAKIQSHVKHSSPTTHWRRGHWRNQPCGEKLQDSKIIWIQPALINPNQE